MNKDEKRNDVLCCPLCGSEEYLLSDTNNMLCAVCGSFFENVTQLKPNHTLFRPIGFKAAYANISH
ncbi:hypothetical protein TW81_05795 [Vibrio galatheae]|uniref:Transcription initiation factor TFIIIB n=1 Tax=Vibrio galatheae TaxID=579748 RepID=A0A0F4NKX5_9VIBR|nr:hypothetical protein [Vibrio galatheae]KJY83840.1 hypothetical protein TW81_05795 [Vibrio galatheae]